MLVYITLVMEAIVGEQVLPQVSPWWYLPRKLPQKKEQDTWETGLIEDVRHYICARYLNPLDTLLLAWTNRANHARFRSKVLGITISNALQLFATTTRLLTTYRRQIRRLHVLEAIRAGNTTSLRWLISYERWRTSFDGGVMYCAAHNKQWKMVKMLYAGGTPWCREVLTFAISYRAMDMVQWLQDHEAPMNEGTFAAAASHGDLPMMKWLIGKKCVWDYQTVVEAIKFGDISILEWMWSQKSCPSFKKDVGKAFLVANLDLFKWADEKTRPRDTTSAGWRYVLSEAMPKNRAWLEANGYDSWVWRG